MYRQRNLDYGENAWPGDFIDDQAGAGIISRTMAVGGSALHWGGVTNRFSEEDLTLKSLYGLAVDWPIDVGRAREALLRSRAAPRRLGRAGPAARGSAIRAVPDAADAAVLQPERLEGVGREERHPVPGRRRRRRTREPLRRPRGVPALQHLRDLSDRRALLARLHVQAAARGEEDRAARSDAGPPAVLDADGTRIVAAQAVARAATAKPSSTARRTFVLASGYAWSPHLLLLSATPRSRTAWRIVRAWSGDT